MPMNNQNAAEGSSQPPDAKSDGLLPMIVGIGGSAGALPALLVLLESLGDNVPMALVVVLHLSPDHESSAAEILQRVTSLIVTQVTTRTLLQPGHVYVIAPGMNLITDDGHVQPAEASTKRPSAVIDLFFRTLAKVHRERAVGIVLSGTGHDGALGLTHVNERGGLTIVQALDECEHDDMPRAAIATGAVDLVLSAEAIGKRLVELAKYPRAAVPPTETTDEVEVSVEQLPSDDQSTERALQDILAALRIRTRHDFRHYKRATLMRRLERRVQVHRLANVQEYRDFVRKHPDELAPLLADMLISVTNFFRDPQAFEAMQRDIIPQILEGTSPGEEARVWIPACASGEESYSVAILFQECADRMPQPPRIQIFASDISNPALAVARAGVYPANIAMDITETRLLASFEKDDGGQYRVRSAIREMIVFAHHNVLSDPPFSRVDLICCRNLLIYLDRTAQAAVLDMFAYALRPGGYLFLGNAESVDGVSAAFEPISKSHRIYRLRPEGAAARLRVRIPSQVSASTATPPSQSSTRGHDFAPTDVHSVAAMHERALVAAASPNVLINADYDLERISPGAGRFIAFGEGVPTRNLLGNVEADIRTELRAALYRANETRRPVKAAFRRNGSPGDSGIIMALSVYPVEVDKGSALYWLVMFDESAEGGSIIGTENSDGTKWEQAIGRLEEENRALKVHLQDTLDRSALSNEELKASNEELQAINEELRSAKEELETSKEELQSMNEELTTVNFELRMKVDESGRNNDDLRNLMEAAEIATVFVDSGMRVKRFTPQASKLFALIPTDVGRPLMDVKSRLHYDDIIDDATAAFNQLRPVERSITSIDGEHFLARILPYRTSQDKIGGAVLTFVDVTQLRHAENLVTLAEERVRDAIAANKDFAVITTDPAGKITTWNEGASHIFGHKAEDIIGASIDLIFTPEDRVAGAPDSERRLATRDGRASDERWHLRNDGTTFFCSGVTTPLHGSRHVGFVKICRDQSETKALEIRQGAALGAERRAAENAKAGNEMRDRFLAVMSHELKQPLNLIQVSAELLTRLPEFANSANAQRIGGTIMKAVDAQETIVNDLLDLSRVQTGKMRLNPEAIDLAQIVQMLFQAIAADAARKGITVDIQVEERLMCYGDPVRIEQVIWNLLGNAVKFTPEGGRVSIEVSVDDAFAKLEVSDTGAGISAEYLPSIFDLFSQAPTAEKTGTHRSGLGIGLALVRDLVKAQGGRIEATSPGLGQGATFTVWMPSAAGLASAAASPTPIRASFSGRRILVVDDERDNLDSFAMLLQMEGAIVDTTTSGSAALTMLAEGDYDLLLSDIGMPEMSGIELVKRARELRTAKSFYRIAITGFGSEADSREALEAGFDAHISKPVSLERLRAALEHL